MNVLMISPYFPPMMAGAELYTHELSKYLVKKGYEVDVITKHFGDLESYELMDGIRVHRVKSLNIPKMRSLLSMPAMLSMALKMNPDLVHAHITYPSGIIAYVLNKIKKTPYIITAQGDELLDCPDSKELRYIIPILIKALKGASKVHTISIALKESLMRNFKVAEEKIEVIPNGVDLSKFKKEPTKDLKTEYKSGFILINVSRLSPKNNVITTIKAVKKVAEEGKNFKYLIVGDGEERDDIKKLINDLDLTSTVILTGWVDHDELPQYIAGSDAFIRTSVSEGLGIVFLEAMACGTPLIASKVHGILDIVEDYKTGLLVDPLDVDQIADKITELIENADLRESLSDNGYDFVRNFDWEKICQRSEELYRDIS